MASHNPLILLVEDDPNDMFLIRRAFKKVDLNQQLFGVWDGKQAISYLSGSDEFSNRELYPMPSILLLDLKLPRVSGLDVLAWLKSQETLKRLVVLVLSASGQSSDVARAYDLGANSYLVKPADFEKLSEIVKLLDSYWFLLNERPEVR
jgi:DNA-binding response OmpR family regulator